MMRMAVVRKFAVRGVSLAIHVPLVADRDAEKDSCNIPVPMLGWIVPFANLHALSHAFVWGLPILAQQTESTP